MTPVIIYLGAPMGLDLAELDVAWPPHARIESFVTTPMGEDIADALPIEQIASQASAQGDGDIIRGLLLLRGIEPGADTRVLLVLGEHGPAILPMLGDSPLLVGIVPCNALPGNDAAGEAFISFERLAVGGRGGLRFLFAMMMGTATEEGAKELYDAASPVPCDATGGQSGSCWYEDLRLFIDADYEGTRSVQLILSEVVVPFLADIEENPSRKAPGPSPAKSAKKSFSGAGLLLAGATLGTIALAVHQSE